MRNPFTHTASQFLGCAVPSLRDTHALLFYSSVEERGRTVLTDKKVDSAVKILNHCVCISACLKVRASGHVLPGCLVKYYVLPLSLTIFFQRCRGDFNN